MGANARGCVHREAPRGECVKLGMFGATGKVGRALVARALETGHEVTALVRDPSKLSLTHPKLRVVKGDATNAKDVDAIVEGQEAILNALGPTKTSPKNILEINTGLVIDAMKRFGAKRTVVVGGAGMRVPQDSQDFGTQAIGWLISKIIADAVKDKQKQFDMLKQSGLEFVILRAPQIKDGPKIGKYTIGYPPMGFGAQITPADLSEAMLEMLSSDKFLGTAPAVRS
jgi:putative NADH-flavin reductase